MITGEMIHAAFRACSPQAKGWETLQPCARKLYNDMAGVLSRLEQAQTTVLSNRYADFFEALRDILVLVQEELEWRGWDIDVLFDLYGSYWREGCWVQLPDVAVEVGRHFPQGPLEALLVIERNELGKYIEA